MGTGRIIMDLVRTHADKDNLLSADKIRYSEELFYVISQVKRSYTESRYGIAYTEKTPGNLKRIFKKNMIIMKFLLLWKFHLSRMMSNLSTLFVFLEI